MNALLASILAAALALPAHAMPDLVILVRHAERAAEPAADPALSPEGEQRARALAQALAGTRVDAILTTQFRRTRDTAAPLAQALGLQPLAIEARRGGAASHVQAVAEAVRAQTGTVLVVGHSNTVPAILAALGGPQLPEICETSFNHIFLLRPGAGWMQLSYGAPSAPPSAGCL
ncbi:SixA phosphatase family protein [Roseateles sp.]|uniref:SixA phosphatase family protein n=1 Tax=Roseateles sp. TaxID=1971397 RepID=UPI0039ED5AE9